MHQMSEPWPSLPPLSYAGKVMVEHVLIQMAKAASPGAIRRWGRRQAFLHVGAPSANHEQVIVAQNQSINLDLFTHRLLLI